MAQIIIDEGLAPSTPSTNKVTLYAKADGLLYSKDDAGTETALSGGGGGGVSDGDKGDITVSSGGSVWTIDNDSVTYAKIQNVSATDKILGRSTAGAGDVEEISCTAAGRALLDDADAAAQRTTLGLGSLATQSGTFSGTSSGTNTGDQNLFSTIAVSGQSDVVADTNSDTLTLVAGANVTITTNAATDTITIAATGAAGAPSDATYIVQTANGTLTNEQALGALATGILKNTTTTGVLSIAAAGTDYLAPPSGTALLKANSGGALANAVVRTDYAEPTTALATGILKNTTTTGAHTIAVLRTDYAEPTTALATGILYNTTTTGVHSIATTAQIGTAIGITGMLKGNGAAAITSGTAGTDYAAPGTATNWTAAQRSALITDNDLSFDLSGAGNNYSCTPTAGAALTFTNIAAQGGKSGFIKLVNGSNYAISAAATTKIATADLTKISATGTYILSYLCDATNVYVMTSGNLA
jgi:hypothetical protein